jgi:hypothetical protein
MTIRLDAVRTFGRNAREWFRQTVPLLCVARYLSDRPIDWLLFWIGWKFLRSSTTYIFDQLNGGERVDAKIDINHSEKEVGDRRYRSRLKTFAATRRATTAGDTNMLLTSVPSVVLSNVACFLHPRDVLDLDTVLRSGMGLRNSEDGSGIPGTTRRLFDDSVGHGIWKQLWYRDYGDVLLRWNVSREAFRRSLTRISPHSTKDFHHRDDCGSNNHAEEPLEEKLSRKLDEMSMMPMPTTMKDFYFVFGECYIDYILARKNSIDECYLGLHGHIFDFTDFAEYHPGLIEPILKECGGDATYHFEDIPHSSAARNIARRLCVLVDHRAIDYDDSNSRRCCGLELVIDDDSSRLKELLRSSNTRPPPPTYSSRGSGVEKKRKRWMAHIVPRRRKWRRHPTLGRIRTLFRQEQRQFERQQLFPSITRSIDHRGSQLGSNASLVTITTEYISSYSPFRRQEESRLYYDPLAQEWVQWCPDGNAPCRT